MTSARVWAERCFGAADLGDFRRTQRLVAMAQRAAQRPGPFVTEVFRNAAERQAAYDFLEHDHVDTADVSDALYCATARASEGHDRVLVVVDGTSLTLTDRARAKDFGAIGTFARGARGIKVMNALALSWDGAAIGLADQQWWTRQAPAGYNRYRNKDDRESRHWRVAISEVADRFASYAPDTKLHFLLDREGDAAQTIWTLVDSGHDFTIRSAARRNALMGWRRRNVLAVLGEHPVLARTTIDVVASSAGAPRQVRLDIRAARLPMLFRDKYDKHTKGRLIEVGVVWARERGRTARDERIEWVLFTNLPVKTSRQALETVHRYAKRWRIEDLHRTWKSGMCRVEETQLRSTNAVIKWATILAAVATRAEHLRRRAREEPDAPATDELTTGEIEALVLLKNDNLSKRAKPVDDVGLTLGTAVRWIADLGGYVGNRGSGPPGATTIARGLEPVLMTAAVLAKLRAEGRFR